MELVNKFDGKYPHKSINDFVEYSGLTKEYIDEIIDSYTSPILFVQDEQGNFIRDLNGNLIKNFNIV